MRYVMIVNTPEPVIEEGRGAADLELPAGCALCGGTLVVRISPAGARSICRQCRWLSSPRLHGNDGEVDLIHPPGALA
jgi:hypothetical protein